MKEKKIVPVILAGGAGSRLWPLSRSGFPKQFLRFFGDSSLFSQSILRACRLASDEFIVEKIVVVTNEEQRFFALGQLNRLDLDVSVALILEPEGKNTACALTLAALELSADDIMVVMAADHVIKKIDDFTNTIHQGVRVASKGSIVTLGVNPSRPETGYGYIRHDSQPDEHQAYPIHQFAEKPDLETAKHYVKSGEYLWNSGMFIVSAGFWLEALGFFRADILTTTKAAWQNRSKDGQFLRPVKALFENIPSESVDYAVMEHCPGSRFSAKVIPLQSDWNDLGAWDAVWEAGDIDENGNTSYGDVMQYQTTNSLVHADKRLVCTIGVDNLIVVETADAVLVANKDNAQDVKKLIELLKTRQREEHALHRKVHRPWGWYDSLDFGERFQVKRILVNPGASLSLQKHHHRAEHWVVVSGTAEVTRDDEALLLTENQSVYIPLGVKHRLTNPGTIPLEIIEIQSGSYLGEDDIVRFEDIYNRE